MDESEAKGPVVFGGASGVPVKAWTRGVAFEDEARAQVERAARLPFIHKWIAVMPDVHRGIGATVGSVIPTLGAVIPAAVGVDIGCGMMAVRTSLRGSQLPDNLLALRNAIEAAVPHGRTNNGGPGDRGAWTSAPPPNQAIWGQLEPGWKRIASKYPRLGKGQDLGHLGTLGTGNHFIEACLDESESVWFLLHSGSRGIGNRIGRHFIELAREDMRQWFIRLPDEDLAYLPEGTEHFDDYVEAVEWAQTYALKNRELMMEAVLAAALKSGLPSFSADLEVVNCHHNYVARENHYGQNVLVTRKGAVRARRGDLGLIPGSMGARSYVVRGLGNEESFQSCSHGAGRRLSRTAAKKEFTLADHAAATAGVECRKDAEVLDETPGAYKPIDDVMKAQADLVEIVHTLKQVVCVKG
jgi:tRNA-splicing ligase RtcB (3'-phosphate/5'-hydroxy nucleic acid ligase)